MQLLYRRGNCPDRRERVMSGEAPASDSIAVLTQALRRMALVSAHNAIRLTPLAGGVSSDIYRVDTGERTLCVKRALPKLKVAADWRAPVERNRYEVAWLREAGRMVPGAVPALLGEDPDAGAFAMEWLPPDRYPVWKSLLRDGTIELSTATAIGDVLGRIHAGTADRPDIAATFPTDAIFHAIRLEPYLVATGRAHPDLAPRLQALVERTATTRRVLVHGDFSPKNILIGPAGPVILDAECAWFGDPAFDVAFVLNHLLLKGEWRPAECKRLLLAFAALVDAYRPHVRWEPWATLDARTAALLPGLLLGRVDGKSPVEYLTEEAARNRVRQFARARIACPPATLAEIAADWGRVRT
jgi:aminoglycoside phosphotransferase (APT) family kinase protein